MGDTLSDGAKIAITICVITSIITMMYYVVFKVNVWNNHEMQSMNDKTAINHIDDFKAMEVYGEPIPIPNIIAALDMYGEPEAICVQIEDLKNTHGGNPYPFAKNNPEEVKKVVALLKDYYAMEVYVYTASPNGLLQLCIAELPHEKNPDGANQNWR